MAHSLRTATETSINMLVDDVIARFPRILARLDEGWGGLEVEADSGLGIEGVPCGIEGFGGLR